MPGQAPTELSQTQLLCGLGLGVAREDELTPVGDGDPAQLWAFYLQLVEVEAAFKELKGALPIRPIFHQQERRIEAHIFVAVIAYCLRLTLKHQLKQRAPGLTVRQTLDKLAAIRMLDVHFAQQDRVIERMQAIVLEQQRNLAEVKGVMRAWMTMQAQRGKRVK